MIEEAKKHLETKLLPFWTSLRDDQYGGWYGYMDYDLHVDKKAVKGCILMSRITWFYANAAMVLKNSALLKEAEHGFRFLKEHCIDHENGGIYWSVTFDGKPADTTKHTYNQAFCIYALSSYYDATKDPEALQIADSLFKTIETKMRDEGGYLEAFDRSFKPVSNEKLSENGVTAERTMNTLLHVLEAYTEFFRVTKREDVRERLHEILDIFESKIWNPVLGRQEVFFDHEYHTLIDLYSYGHDIETSWLLDRTVEILDEPDLVKRFRPITVRMAEEVRTQGFDGRSLPAECEKGVVKEDRVWWVQAETVNGFLNAYQKSGDKKFLEDAKSELAFIRDYVVDPREGSEWFWYVTKDGIPAKEPIVEPWKCPYHNGRMCFEIIRRGIDA